MRVIAHKIHTNGISVPMLLTRPMCSSHARPLEEFTVGIERHIRTRREVTVPVETGRFVTQR